MTPGEKEGAVIARRLLRVARQGALATLMAAGGGAPYSSLVAVASDADGSPLLLISRLAVHTRNLLADSRVSLLLSDGAESDPLQSARIMVAAIAAPVLGDDLARARRRYLSAHPQAELYADFPDFLFVRLQITGVHLVAGFGRISDLTPSEVLTDVTDAESLLAAEDGAVGHMNSDHAGALELYATRLIGAPAGSWRCTGLDPDGLDLAVDGTVQRLNFPARVTTPATLRQTLTALAAMARAAAPR